VTLHAARTSTRPWLGGNWSLVLTTGNVGSHLRTAPHVVGRGLATHTQTHTHADTNTHACMHSGRTLLMNSSRGRALAVVRAKNASQAVFKSASRSRFESTRLSWTDGKPPVNRDNSGLFKENVNRDEDRDKNSENASAVHERTT